MIPLLSFPLFCGHSFLLANSQGTTPYAFFPLPLLRPRPLGEPKETSVLGVERL